MSTVEAKPAVKVKKEYFTGTIGNEVKVKDAPTFGSDKKEKVVKIKIDKKHYKENFPLMEMEKEVAEAKQVYNNQAVTYARELATKEMKKAKVKKAEVIIYNGSGPYDKMTVRVKDNGEDSTISYKYEPKSMTPKNGHMADEKAKLIKAVLGK